MTTIDIDYIKTANKVRGFFFFEPATLRGFSSRIMADVFEGPGGIFFVTSEKRRGFRCEDGERLYTVRRFNKATGSVDTEGEFQGFRTRKQALSRARECAFGTT